jgi:hypothetical protein
VVETLAVEILAPLDYRRTTSWYVAFALRSLTNGGIVVGTIIKPKFGLQPKPFGESCYAFWQGGDFIKTIAGQPGLLPDERMHSLSGEGHACLR